MFLLYRKRARVRYSLVSTTCTGSLEPTYASDRPSKGLIFHVSFLLLPSVLCGPFFFQELKINNAS